MAEYERITRTIVQTESGTQIVEQDSRRVEDVFDQTPPPAVKIPVDRAPGGPPAVPGFTYKKEKNGFYYYEQTSP